LAFLRGASQSRRSSSAGTHTPRRRWFIHKLVHASRVGCSRLCVQETTLGPPSAQSPFASSRRYLDEGDLAHLLAERYPCVIATTDSCAKPVPCARLWLSLVRTLFAGCCQPLLRKGPSRRCLCESFPACLDPYPGGSRGACARDFPRDDGLPGVVNRSAPTIPIQQLQYGMRFRGCSHSLMFRPTGLLATQIAPVVVPWHQAAVASTSEHLTVRCLPVPRIC
jgi:hypothetical protein